MKTFLWTEGSLKKKLFKGEGGTMQFRPFRVIYTLKESKNDLEVWQSISTFIFTFSHFADAFIQSDLQLRNTLND